MATVTIAANEYPVIDTQAAVIEYLAASVSEQATAFIAATSDNQKKAMVEATRVLQRQAWIDSVADDVASANTSDLPLPIRQAFAELSASISNGDLSSVTNASTENLQKRIKAGSVELENFRSFRVSATGTRFALPIWELLKAYLASGQKLLGIKSTGVDRDSAFGQDYSVDLEY